MPFEPGQVINERYRVEAALGDGGFGRVYRAFDLNLQGPCAIKESLDTSAIGKQQLHKEARLLFNLHHEHLPQIYDFFSLPDQGHYIVMQYIAGEDLRQRLNRIGAPLPVAEAVAIMNQVLSALEYLHTQDPPVLHRDVKPENIKITPKGKAVLVDFGVAKVSGQTSTLTRFLPGTPGYAPPEQYEGQVDTRSDVYSCGATLYDLLTNQKPTNSNLRAAGIKLPFPRTLNPEITPELQSVILKALELPQDNRYQNASEFKQALEAAQAQPATVRRPGPGEPVHTEPLPPQPGRRLPLGWIAAFILLGIAVLSGIVFLATKPGLFSPVKTQALTGFPPLSTSLTATAAFPNTISPRLTSTRLPATITRTFTLTPTRTATSTYTFTPTWTATHTFTLTPTPDPRVIQPGNLDGLIEQSALNIPKFRTLRWSPNGQWFIVLADRNIHIYDFATLTRRTFKRNENYPNALTFSPDSKYFAVGFSNNDIHLYDVTDGKLLQEKIKGNSNGAVKTIVWSPNGKWLAAGYTDGVINLWQASDGALVQSISRHKAQVSELVFTQDSQILISASMDDTIRLWQMPDGVYIKTINTVNGDCRRFSSLAISPDENYLVTGSDGKICLWQISTGSMINTCETNSYTYAVAYSPRGDLVASGNNSNYVYLTQTEGFKVIKAMQAHKFIISVAFSPDGLWIAVGSVEGENGLVQIWGIGSQPTPKDTPTP